MRRFFTRRYPPGWEPENEHMFVLKASSIILSVSLFIAYYRWKKVEAKRKALETEYQPVDPNKIIPQSQDLVPIYHEKLRKAVTEGGDKFILEELGFKIVSSPEEWVYHTTKGINPNDKDAYMSFVRKEFEKLPNS